MKLPTWTELIDFVANFIKAHRIETLAAIATFSLVQCLMSAFVVAAVVAKPEPERVIVVATTQPTTRPTARPTSTPRPTATAEPTQAPTDTPARCALLVTVYSGNLSAGVYVLVDGSDALLFCDHMDDQDSAEAEYTVLSVYPTEPVICVNRQETVTLTVVDPDGIIGETFCEGLMSEQGVSG